MTMLVIHAPDARVKKQGAKSFEAVLRDGIGKGYILSQTEVARLISGSRVVLIRKDRNKARAEGYLIRLERTVRTPRGKQRYDVHVNGLKVVPYRPEPLNRYGVLVP